MSLDWLLTLLAQPSIGTGLLWSCFGAGLGWQAHTRWRGTPASRAQATDAAAQAFQPCLNYLRSGQATSLGLPDGGSAPFSFQVALGLLVQAKLNLAGYLRHQLPTDRREAVEHAMADALDAMRAGDHAGAIAAIGEAIDNL